MEASTEAARRPSQLVGTESIWLVEDDDTVRAFAARVLTRHGYDVHDAATPAQALALADQHRGAIDLLLTDMILPGMNGAELASRLRASRPETRVLYMSGDTDATIQSHSLSIHASDLLEKPFTSTTLLHKVRQLLDASSASVPAASLT
jgi:DNA-binding response OmpR family regulator